MLTVGARLKAAEKKIKYLEDAIAEILESQMRVNESTTNNMEKLHKLVMKIYKKLNK